MTVERASGPAAAMPGAPVVAGAGAGAGVRPALGAAATLTTGRGHQVVEAKPVTGGAGGAGGADGGGRLSAAEEATARAHPLVKQAETLFSARVVGVHPPSADE